MENEGWVQPSSGGGGTGPEFQSRPWEREQRGQEMAAPGGQSVPRALRVHWGPPRGKLRDRKGLCLTRTTGPGTTPSEMSLVLGEGPSLPRGRAGSQGTFSLSAAGGALLTDCRERVLLGWSNDELKQWGSRIFKSPLPLSFPPSVHRPVKEAPILT